MHRAGAIAALAASALLVAGSVPTAAEPWVTHLYGPQQAVGRSTTDEVPEASGVVPSMRRQNVYWTHNDSGAYRPRVYAFRLSPEDRRRGTVPYLGRVELLGARIMDWEDIAAGPDGFIYVLDGGDNPPCHRIDKRIYRFKEPALPDTDGPAALRLGCQWVPFEYPDPADSSRPAARSEDRYDAETLFVHPRTGDMYIVTKLRSNGRPVARLYKLPAGAADWSSRRPSVLRFVTDLSDHVSHMVTAGDVSSDGRRVLLRNYWAMYRFGPVPSGEPFETIFEQPPLRHPLPREAMQLLQGEGICWAHDGRDVVTVTESPRGSADDAFRVFIAPWRLANVRVERDDASSATVVWQTAEPAPSRVDYRTPDGQLLFEENPRLTTHPRVTLSGLEPATCYGYRVRAGALLWPLGGAWPEFCTASAPATVPETSAAGPYPPRPLSAAER